MYRSEVPMCVNAWNTCLQETFSFNPQEVWFYNSISMFTAFHQYEQPSCSTLADLVMAVWLHSHRCTGPAWQVFKWASVPACSVQERENYNKLLRCIDTRCALPLFYRRGKEVQALIGHLTSHLHMHVWTHRHTCVSVASCLRSAQIHTDFMEHPAWPGTRQKIWQSRDEEWTKMQMPFRFS